MFTNRCPPRPNCSIRIGSCPARAALTSRSGDKPSLRAAGWMRSHTGGALRCSSMFGLSRNCRRMLGFCGLEVTHRNFAVAASGVTRLRFALSARVEIVMRIGGAVTVLRFADRRGKERCAWFLWRVIKKTMRTICLRATLFIRPRLRMYEGPRNDAQPLAPATPRAVAGPCGSDQVEGGAMGAAPARGPVWGPDVAAPAAVTVQ